MNIFDDTKKGVKNIFDPEDNSTMGIIKNTITGLPKAAVDVYKPLFKPTVNYAKTGFENVKNLVTNPKDEWNKSMFGIPTPTVIGQRNETLSMPKNNVISPQQQQQKDTLNQLSEFEGLAMGYSGGLENIGAKIAKNVTPQLMEYLARETNPNAIEEVLKKVGADDATAKFYAPQLAQTKNVAEVENIFYKQDPLLPNGTTRTPETTQSVDGKTILPESKISQEISPTTTPSDGTGISKPLQSETGLPKNSSYLSSIQQQILEARDAQQAIDRANITEADPSEFPQETHAVREMAKNIDTTNNAKAYQDIGQTKTQLRDLTRNTEQVFGKDFPTVDDTLLNPLEQSKGNLIRWYDKKIADFKASPAAQFKKGSPESAAIQELGEGVVTYDDVVKKFGSTKAKQISDSIPFFRDNYDNIIENELWPVQQRIYPNNPGKWTPKLENYFRHGSQAQSGMARLQTIYDNPTRIDPMLVGQTEGTKPLSKWQSFKQTRIFKKSDKPDAIGGYLDYIANAGYSIHIDPHIGRFRAFADDLALNTINGKNLNNYIYQLRKYADRLAGKSSDIDRSVSDVIGRTNMEAVNLINNRVKANTVMGNISSSLAQLGNIPQGISNAGIQNSLKGATKTIGQIFTPNELMKQSNFMSERFFKGFDQFDTGILKNPKNFAKWMITVLDKTGTKFIWNSQIEKAKQAGFKSEKDLIRYADRETKKLVAGRGIGDLPLLQSSKVFQLVAPFQVEVTNLWWAMEDIGKGKNYVPSKNRSFGTVDKSKMQKFGQYATLLVSLYLLNNAFEKTKGSRVLFDPIQAGIDAGNELKANPNMTGVAKAGGRIAGEVLENIPLGQTFANLYPEYGANALGVKFPTRRSLFGREDPTRFGSSSLLMKGIQNPFFKIIPPFGGTQLQKTIQGVTAVEKGKSTSSNNSWQYSIDPNLSNYIKGTLFGKSSLPEAQAYYNKKNKSKPSTTKENIFD